MNIYIIKIFYFFCVCIKWNHLALKQYNGKKWINVKYFETAFGYKNLVGNKTQYCSDEFEKRRYELQDCEGFQSRRKFVAEELAIHLIIDIKTVEAAELKIKLGFNPVDLIMSKQESIGLKLKKKNLCEEMIEDLFAPNYLIDFYFPKYNLAIEIDELDHADRDSVKEDKRQKELKEHLKCIFIRINPDQKDFSAYDGLGEIYRFFVEFKKR